MDISLNRALIARKVLMFLAVCLTALCILGIRDAISAHSVSYDPASYRTNQATLTNTANGAASPEAPQSIRSMQYDQKTNHTGFSVSAASARPAENRLFLS